MPPPLPNQTVFLGRETPVSRDQIEVIRQSIEADISQSSDESLEDPEPIHIVKSDDDDAELSKTDDQKATEKQKHNRTTIPPSTLPEKVQGLKRRPGRPSKRRHSTSVAKVPEVLSNVASASKTLDHRPPSQNLRMRIRSAEVPSLKKQRMASAHVRTHSNDTRGRGRPPKASKPMPVVNNKDREWEVEKIIASKIDEHTREHFYLVKWKGFAAKENTWEPKKNLGRCHQAIQEYEKRSSKKV